MLPLSVPANPRLRGQATPGDIGSITEEMQSLATSDYRGSNQGYNQTGAGGTYGNQGGAGVLIGRIRGMRMMISRIPSQPPRNESALRAEAS
ncbi:hypothetical protein C8J56DRAFT_405213 [Mycena floridula]|nr:hypothetical protein C8J56DRAFT_405213 [Mycena floridula]